MDPLWGVFHMQYVHLNYLQKELRNVFLSYLLVPSSRCSSSNHWHRTTYHTLCSTEI